MSKEQVTRIVAETNGALDIVIIPSASANHKSNIRGQTSIFLKSKINWDPKLDPGLPVQDKSMK